MDEVRCEVPDSFREGAAEGIDDGKVTPIETLLRRDPDDLFFMLRSIFKLGCNGENLMPFFPETLGEYFDGASHPADVRREGVGDHQDFHVS